jgi:3-hydroxyacyl-CoA dehydrogenase
LQGPIKLVKLLSNQTENFGNLHNSNKENTAKLVEIVSEKMKDQENKEDTVKLLEALSQRIKFLEKQKNTSIDTEGKFCIFENNCYAQNFKMGECTCEFCRK